MLYTVIERQYCKYYINEPKFGKIAYTYQCLFIQQIYEFNKFMKSNLVLHTQFPIAAV